MPYEVVDPAEREWRGLIYPNLTDAMVNAGPRLEVWELADDEAQTRTVCCWPDPEFQPAVSLADARVERQVTELVARADREAAGIVARIQPVDPATWPQIVALAWKYGYVAGYGDCADRAKQAFDRLERVYGQ